MLQHEIGHTIGLEHGVLSQFSPDGFSRMNRSYPSGGWFHSLSNRVVPLGQDRFEANLLYPATASYGDLYMSNVQSLIGSSLSAPLSANSTTGVVNLYPLGANSGSGRAWIGETIQFLTCYGNLGPSTVSGNVSAALSLDRNNDYSDILLGTWPVTLWGRQRRCDLRSAVVPTTTPGGPYSLVYGNGTSGNNVAVVDQRLTVINL